MQLFIAMICPDQTDLAAAAQIHQQLFVACVYPPPTYSHKRVRACRWMYRHTCARLQTQEENENQTRWGDVCWAVACRQGDEDRAPIMPSVLQLPLELREPHDQDDDVLGPHPEVSIKIWAERLSAHVWVRAHVCASAHMCCWDNARVNTVGYSSRKQWSQSSAGAFYNSSVCSKSPPACFHRQLTVTSCSHKEMWGGNLGCSVVRLFVLPRDSVKGSRKKVLCDFVNKTTKACFYYIYKAFREHREKHKTIKPLWFDNGFHFSET